MEPSKTISELKASFVRSQIRILSTFLAPSEGWREYGPPVEEDLGDKAVEDVLHKCKLSLNLYFIYSSFLCFFFAVLHIASNRCPFGMSHYLIDPLVNTVLRQHHRAVFSTQAIHHVARQVESLYWNSINPELGGDGTQSLELEKGTDWTHSKLVHISQKKKKIKTNCLILAIGAFLYFQNHGPGVRPTRRKHG